MATKLRKLQLKNFKPSMIWVPTNPSTRLNLQETRSVTPSNPYYSLQKKGMGELKSRKVAIGSKQRSYDGYDKSASSSPTVTTKGLVMTCAINAYEERDNAIVDVGVAFLHANNNEEILMKLRGKIVELLVQLKPTMYRKYVTMGPNREPILYVRLLKALYGLLRLALLFYKIL